VKDTTTDLGARQSAANTAIHNRAQRSNLHLNIVAGAGTLLSQQAFGQSVWLDDLRRSLFTSGDFRRLVAEDGLRGVTSNPSIFERRCDIPGRVRTAS
jgi:hypothetical protein